MDRSNTSLARRCAARWPLLVVAVAACSGDDDRPVGDGGGGDDGGRGDGGGDGGSAVDAGPPGPCWPVEGATPRGSIELGTGSNGFQAMPEELPLIYGEQGGFHVEVHARMTGFEPGNPLNSQDPANPRTRFRVFFVDTGLPINPYACPTRLAYEAAGGDSFELLRGNAVQFDTALCPSEVFGRELRIVVEIMNAAGTGYATDERTITGAEPTFWADAGPCTPQ